MFRDPERKRPETSKTDQGNPIVGLIPPADPGYHDLALPQRADAEKAAQQWQRLAVELRQYREGQMRDWQGVDEALIARHFLGAATAEDQQKLQAALQDPNGKVARCLTMLEELLTDPSPLESPSIKPHD